MLVSENSLNQNNIIALTGNYSETNIHFADAWLRLGKKMIFFNEQKDQSNLPKKILFADSIKWNQLNLEHLGANPDRKAFLNELTTVYFIQENNKLFDIEKTCSKITKLLSINNSTSSDLQLVFCLQQQQENIETIKKIQNKNYPNYTILLSPKQIGFHDGFLIENLVEAGENQLLFNKINNTKELNYIFMQDLIGFLIATNQNKNCANKTIWINESKCSTEELLLKFNQYFFLENNIFKKNKFKNLLPKACELSTPKQTLKFGEVSKNFKIKTDQEVFPTMASSIDRMFNSLTYAYKKNPQAKSLYPSAKSL